MATGEYRDHLNYVVAHRIKRGDDNAIDYAARHMAGLVPKNAVIVPIPGHLGYADHTKKLAIALSRYTGQPVADVLQGIPRETNYRAKLNGTPQTESQMGMFRTMNLPSNLVPVFVDNVIDTGTSGRAAVHAFGNRGIVLAFAMTQNLWRQTLQIEEQQTSVMRR